jgi:hypothetical protein
VLCQKALTKNKIINAKGDSIMANGDANSTRIGMGNAAYNGEYQAKLDEKISQVMGNEDKISTKDLKKNSIFSKVYEALDGTGKANFDKIVSLDGDSTTVNKNELRTLLMILDADLTNINGRDVFLVDNEIGTNKETSGIYQATDDEIKAQSNSLKTDDEKREDVEQQVKKYDCTDGSQLANALNLVYKHRSLFGGKNAVSVVLKEQIAEHDPTTNSYSLKDGRTLYYTKSLNHRLLKNENILKIVYPDGTEEKYNNKGEKIK